MTLHEWFAIEDWRQREHELAVRLSRPAPAPLTERLAAWWMRRAAAGTMRRDGVASISRHTGGRV